MGRKDERCYLLRRLECETGQGTHYLRSFQYFAVGPELSVGPEMPGHKPGGRLRLCRDCSIKNETNSEDRPHGLNV